MQKPTSTNPERAVAKPSATRDLLRNTIFRRLSTKNNPKDLEMHFSVILETKKKVTAPCARENTLTNRSQIVERRSQKACSRPAITFREIIMTHRKSTNNICGIGLAVTRKESIHKNTQDCPEFRETNCSFEGHRIRTKSISNQSFLSKPTTNQKTERIGQEFKKSDLKVCRKLTFEFKETDCSSFNQSRKFKNFTRHCIGEIHQKAQTKPKANYLSKAGKPRASDNETAPSSRRTIMSPLARISCSPISVHFNRILKRMDSFLLTGPFAVIAEEPLKFDVSKTKRVFLFNKFAKLVLNFPVRERTWFLAVELFEQLNTLVEVPDVKLELTSLACFAIAAKTETVRSPTLRALLDKSHLRDSLTNLLILEDYVLKVFDYRIIQVLTYDYYTTFSHLAGFEEKEHKMGLLILKLYTSESAEYIREKQLVAFSVCYLLSKRFKFQPFWVHFLQNGHDHIGLKIQSQGSAICDYAFETTTVEHTCKAVVDACSNCSTRDYDSIFQLFSSTKNSFFN